MVQLDWNNLGFVLASEHRKKVLLVIANNPQTPKEIATKTGLYLSHVSKTLKELREKGLVELLSPSLRRGRIFSITPIGKELALVLKERIQ